MWKIIHLLQIYIPFINMTCDNASKKIILERYKNEVCDLNLIAYI